MCSYIISECVNYISIAYYYQTHKLKNARLCIYILYFFALKNKKYSLKKQFSSSTTAVKCVTAFPLHKKM